MSNNRQLNLEKFFLEYSKITDDAEKVDYLQKSVRKFRLRKEEDKRALCIFLLEQYSKVPKARDVTNQYWREFTIKDFTKRYSEIEAKEDKMSFLKALELYKYSAIRELYRERYLHFLVKEFFNWNEEERIWILNALCKNHSYFALNFLLWLEDNGYEIPPSKEDLEVFIRNKPGCKTSNQSKPEKKSLLQIRNLALKYLDQQIIVDAALHWTVRSKPINKGVEFLIEFFRSVDSIIGKHMSIRTLNMLFREKKIKSPTTMNQLSQFVPEIKELYDVDHPIYMNMPYEQIIGITNEVKKLLDNVKIDRLDFSDKGIDVLFDDTYESAKNVVNECNSKKHLPVLLKILESRYEGVRSVALEKFFELTEKLDVKLLPQLNNILDLLQVPDEFDYFFSYLDEEIELKDDLVIEKVKDRSKWDIPKILKVLDKFREWFNELFVYDYPPPYFDPRLYPDEFDDAEEIEEEDYPRIITLFFGALEVYDVIREPEEFEPFLHSTGIFDEERKKITSPIDKEFLIFIVFLGMLGKRYEIPTT